MLIFGQEDINMLDDERVLTPAVLTKWKNAFALIAFILLAVFGIYKLFEHVQNRDRAAQRAVKNVPAQRE